MTRSNPWSAPALLFLSSLGALALPAGAFQPLITDDTGTQGERGNQVEVALDADRVRAAGEKTRVRVLPFTYTRGLTDALDVFAGVSHVTIHSGVAAASGGGNAVLGAKWRFLEDEAAGRSFAIKPEVFLPVNHTREELGLGDGRTSWAVTLILTQAVAFGAVHANLSSAQHRFRAEDAPKSTVVVASIAPVWDVAPNWKLALDAGLEWERSGGVTTRARFAEVGVIYSPNEDLDFAFGAIYASNSAEPRETATSATLGVTWRFK